MGHKLKERTNERSLIIQNQEHIHIPWRLDPRVVETYERLNLARRHYNNSNNRAEHHKALNQANRRYKRAKRLAKARQYHSLIKKLGDGRMDLYFQMRRHQLRPLSAEQGGPLPTAEAVRFWKEIFTRDAADPAIGD